jgi:hypothetical protein
MSLFILLLSSIILVQIVLPYFSLDIPMRIRCGEAVCGVMAWR